MVEVKLAIVLLFMLCGSLMHDLTVLGKQRQRDGSKLSLHKKHGHGLRKHFRPTKFQADSTKDNDDFQEKDEHEVKDKTSRKHRTKLKDNYKDDKDESTNDNNYGRRPENDYKKPTQATKQSFKPTSVKETTIAVTTVKSRVMKATPSTNPTAELQSTPVSHIVEYSGSGDQEKEGSGNHIVINTRIRSFTPTTHPTAEAMITEPTESFSTTDPTKISGNKEKSLTNGYGNENNETNENKEKNDERVELKEHGAKQRHKHVNKTIKGNYKEDLKTKERYEYDAEDNNETNEKDNADDSEADDGKSTRKNDLEDTEKRVLCIGDSITEGYHKGGFAFHPYTKKLHELLNAENNTITYDVYNEGVSGECVFVSMLERMPHLLQKYKPLDLVVILGGTNDLMHTNCTDAGQLFNNIKKLHEMAHAAHVKTVALTIPDANAPAMPMWQKRESMWKETNEKIREYADKRDDVILCDLAEELPYRTMTDDERAKYWDDNLHYTPHGYDKMAELIYDAIQGMF
eukprot:gene8112-8981_t